VNILDAIDVIESVSGFTDESTPVGEAWRVVISYIYLPVQERSRIENSSSEPEKLGGI